ncbi:MAG: hypothetical protein JSU70_17720 [Phycisphaerales bacterium]|nr:MAG: hypothetical protein JSU70_17720 [Phycisphaerales bacterium]
MRTSVDHLVKAITTGLVVLILMSLPLFWARRRCEAVVANKLDLASRGFSNIEPSGLVPTEFENDPNVVQHSHIDASVYPAPVFLLGLVDYVEARVPGLLASDIYYYLAEWGYITNDGECAYFDGKTGKILFSRAGRQSLAGETPRPEYAELYAGPEGISESPDKNLGRFASPLIAAPSPGLPLTLYDKKVRCFYRIDMGQRTVVKGPQLSQDDPHKPVSLGRVMKKPHFVNMRWHPPRVESSEEGRKKIFGPSQEFTPIVRRSLEHPAGQYLLVLDEAGRIDLLDRETLQFAGAAGYLPAPQTLFPSKELVVPDDLLAYRVLPLALETDDKYRGMFVTSLGREGIYSALAVFDERGRLVHRYDSEVIERLPRGDQRRVPSSRVSSFQVRAAPAPTIAKFLLENLHPPLLSVVSYFTANSIEATAGYRALFVLPNSFVAMKGRDVSGNIVGRFLGALLLILPSIVMAMLLAWLISNDAVLVGLSEKTRLCWIIATIAFGLAAYITYRLTRPQITLVTCLNCGWPRRPDMDRCHRCRSEWHVPDLTPPAWRVLAP